MSVLRFKPNRLSYLVAYPGYEDDNGDYHPGESYWSDEIKCDIQPAGAANEIKFGDGSTKVYSYDITLPKNCKSFKIGSLVKIKMLDGQWQEFTVKSFQRYQLQCKMWL